MPGKIKGSFGKASMMVSLGTGVTCAWLVTILAAVVMAFLVDMEYVAESKISLAAVIVLCISSFMGAVAASKMMGEKRMIICLISGIVYYLGLICVNWLFFDGQLQGVLGAALTIIGCSVVAALLGARQKKQKISYFKGRRKA